MVQLKRARPVPLSRWIENVIRLPAGLSAVAGPIKLHPYQKQIADALSDPRVERVSVLKSARVGFTTILVGAIAHYIVREPSPVLVLMPTESDARGLMVDDIETVFLESPALADKLPMPHPGKSDRNTLVHRLFKGGSLKIVAAGAPRNMRRHSARVLLIDEVDAAQVTAEGDAVALATQRTLTWPNRKIIAGGTPLDEATSTITRLYGESDQRVWQVPCPHCRVFSEITWQRIEWPTDHPELAAWRCPACDELVQESHKAKITREGRWCVLRPEAVGHAGFKINALASLLPNAAWGKLAAEWLRAKDDSTRLRVFQNTVLGEPWREDGDDIDQHALAARAEPFDLDQIPAEVLAITVGIDVQDDRLELTFAGWSRDGGCYVLHHETLWGSPVDLDTWSDLDALLRQRWKHPHGGELRVDACAIDAGDGGHYDAVLKFCQPRLARKVFAIKGGSGFGRSAIVRAKTKRGVLFIVGVDALKSQLFNKLERGRGVRFSRSLRGEYFEQLTSERRVARMVRGKPVVRFERKPGQRAESLDCLVYAQAARAALTLTAASFEQRETDLRSPIPPTPSRPTVVRSSWMDKQTAHRDPTGWR